MSKIEIESCFVEAWNRNEEQHPAWGMKTAEPHSKKDDAGKWQTVSRTYRTVKASRDSGIDFTQFRKGDRVHVWGSEKTEVREYDSNGVPRKAYELVVWADRVEIVGGPAPVAEEPWNTTTTTQVTKVTRTGATVEPSTAEADVWPANDQHAPF